MPSSTAAYINNHALFIAAGAAFKFAICFDFAIPPAALCSAGCSVSIIGESLRLWFI